MRGGGNNDLKITFLIVLHLEKLNGYFKICLFCMCFHHCCQQRGANCKEEGVGGELWRVGGWVGGGLWRKDCVSLYIGDLSECHYHEVLCFGCLIYVSEYMKLNVIAVIIAHSRPAAIQPIYSKYLK